ncbi:MAG: carboxypeptidase regulatory-like domain-containing protein [Pyrinomonadaceae bacterium]
MLYFRQALLHSVCLCLLTLSLVGQTSEGGILVTVRDQFGGTVAGAEVFLSRSGEKDKHIKTNSLGVAQFSRLPAADYQIVVSAKGFKEYKSENLLVRTGDSKRIEIDLEVAPIESNVEIGDSDLSDAEKTGATVVLNEGAIANLPDDQVELERAIKRIGEAVTGEELPITVNGVQGGKIPPKEAIQQIRVNQNVFSAQYDGPFGGGIEIFTRSNVDRYTGYVSLGFADSRFNAADPFLGRRVPYQSRSVFSSLSGPLFGKKANFFAYGSHSESDSSAVINAIVLDSNLQPFPIKQSVATPSRSDGLYLTINADPTKEHKLYLSYNFGISRAKGQNVGGFSLESRANDNNSQNHYLQLSDTYLINPNIVNQSRFLVTYFTNESFGGSNEPAINVLDAFFGGGSQQNVSSKILRFDAANETTWQMGKYALGLGFRIRGERVNQNSTANFGGTYTFSGRVAPVLDANNNPITRSDGTVVTAQIDSLESYRRTLLFRQLGFTNERIRGLGGGANQFTISGGDPAIKISQYDLGFYVQNSYKVSETIAASFGIRYENQTNINSNFNLAPRFGLIWAPKAKEKQNPLYTLPRISVGYGMFFSRFALNNTLLVRQASDAGRAQYLITETNILDTYPTVPTVDLLQQFALPQTQRFIDDEFETPYQSLLNITAAKKMPKGFTLNFTFSRGKTFRQAFTQNINAPLAGTFDAANPSLAVRPFGNTGNIYESRSVGRAETDRYSINVGFPQSPNLYGNIRYSFAKSMSGVASGSGSSFDAYDFSQEFGPTPFDGVHSIGGYFYYTLPVSKISIGSDFSISSGSRFNIFTGRDTNGDGFYSERPSFASDLSRPNLISTDYGILDPNPLPGDKIIPRNLGRGPRNIAFNSSVSKRFGFNEDKKNKKPPKQTLNFSLRVSNIFNIINKGTPVGNMSSPNFLRSLSGFSDGGTFFINGAQQITFPGRSMSASVGFGF